MAKKAKSEKSKAKKTKSESRVTGPETPDVGVVSPSFSTDDVYNLLKAVNEVTLKRMENKTDAIQASVSNVSGNVTDIQSKVGNVLNALQQLIQQILPGMQQETRTDLTRINNWVNSILAYAQDIDQQVLPRLEQEILTIKAKTDRLP